MNNNDTSKADDKEMNTSKADEKEMNTSKADDKEMNTSKADVKKVNANNKPNSDTFKTSKADNFKASTATKGVDGNVEDKKEQDDFGIDRESMTDDKYIELLEEKLGQCIAETVLCRNLTQRLQADFDNFRKRNSSIAEDMKQFGISMVVEKLLSVLDNCDLARKYISDESALIGFNMMESQILIALDSYGLKEVVTEGKMFDAKLMSAVESEKSEGQEGKVIGVIAKGYTMNDKLLRPASVKVGK